MAISITTNNQAYVRDDTPSVETHYHARFYFNLNNVKMGKNDSHVIFNAYNNANAPTMTIQLRLSGKSYQLRAGLLNDRNKWVYTSWATLVNGWQPIEFDWRASTGAGANNGNLTFWVNGVQIATITGADNDTQKIESVALGAVEGIDTATRGTYYFDAFESYR
jgi:hypothetical protein